MFCTKCGSELRERDRFCAECATPTARLPLVPINREARLSRARKGKIAGVCLRRRRGGHGGDHGDPFVATIAYVIAWMVMPQDPVALPEPMYRSSQIYT